MVLTKCRLCLKETNKYIEIFHDTFPKMIFILTGVKVDPEDGLPSSSCLQCHKDVKMAMLTRYQIINSHNILVDQLKHKVEEYIEDNLNTASDYPNHETEFEIKQELFCKKDTAIGNCVSVRDCYDSVDSVTCDEDNNSKPIMNISTNNYTNKEEEIKSEATNPPKQGENEISTRLRKKYQRKIIDKEVNVKFRKKKINSKTVAEDRIEFKRKRLSDNPYLVKVQYDIKPEHQEYLKTVGRKDRVPCPDCGRVMFGMNMRNHLITHNYDPVICTICGKSSKNAQALQDHINYYHKTTPDRFMCDKCGKGYRVRFMLQRHEKKEHGNGEKDYECSICGKKFFEKLHLKNHINITHKKIKPYKCEHCGKDFGRRTQFVTHQLVHTKENRYHCQVCGKGFKIKQTMQTHLKGVHGIEEEKTIFCKICQKGFSTAQGLRAHINSRVHGLEKCEHCSEFITVEYKSVHLRDIHGINSESSVS